MLSTGRKRPTASAGTAPADAGADDRERGRGEQNGYRHDDYFFEHRRQRGGGADRYHCDDREREAREWLQRVHGGYTGRASFDLGDTAVYDFATAGGSGVEARRSGSEAG